MLGVPPGRRPPHHVLIDSLANRRFPVHHPQYSTRSTEYDILADTLSLPASHP